MRWHRRGKHKYQPEDASTEHLAADRIEAHQKEELRTMGEAWDEAIRERMDEPLSQASQAQRWRRRAPRKGVASDLVWGNPEEAAPAPRRSRVS
jgi:hypothetical protein